MKDIFVKKPTTRAKAKPKVVKAKEEEQEEYAETCKLLEETKAVRTRARKAPAQAPAQAPAPIEPKPSQSALDKAMILLGLQNKKISELEGLMKAKDAVPAPAPAPAPVSAPAPAPVSAPIAIPLKPYKRHWSLDI